MIDTRVAIGRSSRAVLQGGKGAEKIMRDTSRTNESNMQGLAQNCSRDSEVVGGYLYLEVQ
jgi:hypothetical protein